MTAPAFLLEAAKDSLKHWHLEPAHIDAVSQSENIVYKVISTDGLAYALRLHRPGYHSLGELISEQIWIEALRKTGLNVPHSLRSHQGDYFVAVDCGDTIRYAGLIDWFDGLPLNEIPKHHQAPVNPLAYLGQTCARMHNQATQWQPPAEFERHEFNIEGFFGCKPFWGRFWEVPDLSETEKTKFLIIRDQLIALLTAYGQPADTYSMIHADMHEGNVMVSHNDFLLIDFDDAGFGWHQYDIAVALFNHAESNNYETLKDTLIRHYRQIRNLSDDDLALLPYFILIRALVNVSWLHLRPEHHQPGLIPTFISRALRIASKLKLIST